MASLTWHRKGHRVRYRIYYPDGTSRVEAVEHTRQREATLLLGQAEKLESLTLQNALTPEVAIPCVHLGLLTDDDLARWFPRRPGPLHYDREALLEAYRGHCLEHCTSQDTIRENLRRAGKFVRRLGHLASLIAAGIRAWRQARLGEVSRKTVNLEMDTLRQLLDFCQRFGWRDDNPAWTLGKLPWKPSR